MGWNELRISSRIRCWPASPTGDHAYFVHSFQLKAGRPETVLALTDYGGPITAIVGRDNLAGTQFHPEKSQATGPSADRQFPALEALSVGPGRVEVSRAAAG